jgi:signal transduction histidine kinase
MFKTDIHTIFLILALNKFLLGLLLFHIRTITKGKVNGVDYWAYGSILSGAGLLLTAFFNNDLPLHQELFFSLGLNILILSGDIIFLFGLLRFKGKPLKRMLWILPALSVVNIIIFTLVSYDIALRFLLNAVFPVILYTVTAYEFMKSHHQHLKSSFIFAAGLYIFYGTIHITRIILFSIYPITVPVPDNPVSTILVLMAGLSMILLTYVLIVIITKTLTFALNEQISSRDKLHAIISHDLRGPVGNLLCYTETLKDSVNDWSKEQIAEWVQHMETAASGSRFLLENLFNWSRSRLNEINVDAQEHDIRTLIQNVLKQTEGTAKKKEIEIRFLCQQPMKVRLDSDMIEIVFRNLISNSVKFTPRAGTIIISVAETVSHAEILISDTGIGMSQEAINQILETHSPLSTFGTENEKGSGFGLLLCRDFIKLNNGEFFIESEPGKGSRFRISFPKTEAHEKQ